MADADPLADGASPESKWSADDRRLVSVLLALEDDFSFSSKDETPWASRIYYGKETPAWLNLCWKVLLLGLVLVPISSGLLVAAFFATARAITGTWCYPSFFAFGAFASFFVIMVLLVHELDLSVNNKIRINVCGFGGVVVYGVSLYAFWGSLKRKGSVAEGTEIFWALLPSIFAWFLSTFISLFLVYRLEKVTTELRHARQRNGIIGLMLALLKSTSLLALEAISASISLACIPYLICTLVWATSHQFWSRVTVPNNDGDFGKYLLASFSEPWAWANIIATGVVYPALSNFIGAASLATFNGIALSGPPGSSAEGHKLPKKDASETRNGPAEGRDGSSEVLSATSRGHHDGAILAEANVDSDGASFTGTQSSLQSLTDLSIPSVSAANRSFLNLIVAQLLFGSRVSKSNSPKPGKGRPGSAEESLLKTQYNASEGLAGFLVRHPRLSHLGSDVCELVYNSVRGFVHSDPIENESMPDDVRTLVKEAGVKRTLGVLLGSNTSVLFFQLCSTLLAVWQPGGISYALSLVGLIATNFAFKLWTFHQIRTLSSQTVVLMDKIARRAKPAGAGDKKKFAKNSRKRNQIGISPDAERPISDGQGGEDAAHGHQKEESLDPVREMEVDALCTSTSYEMSIVLHKDAASRNEGVRSGASEGNLASGADAEDAKGNTKPDELLTTLYGGNANTGAFLASRSRERGGKLLQSVINPSAPISDDGTVDMLSKELQKLHQSQDSVINMDEAAEWQNAFGEDAMARAAGGKFNLMGKGRNAKGLVSVGFDKSDFAAQKHRREKQQGKGSSDNLDPSTRVLLSVEAARSADNVGTSLKPVADIASDGTADEAIPDAQAGGKGEATKRSVTRQLRRRCAHRRARALALLRLEMQRRNVAATLVLETAARLAVVAASLASTWLANTLFLHTPDLPSIVNRCAYLLAAEIVFAAAMFGIGAKWASIYADDECVGSLRILSLRRIALHAFAVVYALLCFYAAVKYPDETVIC